MPVHPGPSLPNRAGSHVRAADVFPSETEALERDPPPARWGQQEPGNNWAKPLPRGIWASRGLADPGIPHPKGLWGKKSREAQRGHKKQVGPPKAFSLGPPWTWQGLKALCLQQQPQPGNGSSPALGKLPESHLLARCPALKVSSSLLLPPWRRSFGMSQNHTAISPLNALLGSSPHVSPQSLLLLLLLRASASAPTEASEHRETRG